MQGLNNQQSINSNAHKQINTSSFFFTGAAHFLPVLTVALDRIAGTPWP
jgi:hypothetical protein